LQNSFNKDVASGKNVTIDANKIGGVIGELQSNPSQSLKTAFGKALETVANNRLAGLLTKMGASEEESMDDAIHERVDGYKYLETIIGDNKHSYSDVTLVVFGEKVEIDRLIYLASPDKFNIITGALDLEKDGVAGTHFSIESPTYTVMGKIAKGDIRLNAFATIKTPSGSGRIVKGFIVVEGKNLNRLEAIFQNRVNNGLMNYVNRTYTTKKSRERMINWLISNKYLK